MNRKKQATAVNAEQLDALFQLFNSVQGVEVSGSSLEEVRANFRRARKANPGSEGSHAGLRKAHQ